MAQIKNRFDIENFINNGDLGNKKLPNFFVDNSDGIGVFSSLALSVIFHIAFVLLLIFFSIFFNLVFPHLPKPELPNRNIEFKLVQNESKPPINKNTKNRSDRDSQAGGKHDPKKSESEPSKAAAPQVKSSVPKKQIQKVQPKKQVQKPVANPQTQKTPIKQPVKPIEQPSKVVSKPSPIKPSVVKPAVIPVAKPQGTVVPTAPKVVSAPKSPFAVPVPKTSAPVGTTYKPSGAPSASSSGGDTGSVAPVPKFSSTGAASSKGSSGVSGGQYASKGSYGGYGAGGNPSPGNPNGAPGIDAIREPNWGPYMKDLEQRIKRNWTPPKGDSSKRVVITFTIGRDGRLLSSKVTKSSGVPLADRAAMSAIELTAPFRPLPPEFRGQSVPIEFTFDYNVINSIMR
ncbi:MAG: TonB family protein [Candidatus Gastranaerophilales bacterium]|nr:TonB family protein [Candidatus Gastranaerophilales bacterium]